VHAVWLSRTAASFEHGGVDYMAHDGRVFNDMTSGHRSSEGGSTLTMQLARGFFLTPERRIKRKLIEIVITFQLEHRFTKKQIFEMYANQINLGQRGSFSIDGFGEAAQAYFGKDVRQLRPGRVRIARGNDPEPNYLNPFRHPDRAIERRNLVLDSMVETGAITKEQAERAKAEPLHLTAGQRGRQRSALFSSTWCTISCCKSSAIATSTAKGCASTPRSIPTCSACSHGGGRSTIHVVDEQVDKLHARDKKAGKPLQSTRRWR
jgi:penicillin-binding protein 1B